MQGAVYSLAFSRRGVLAIEASGTYTLMTWKKLETPEIEEPCKPVFEALEKEKANPSEAAP